MTVRTFGGADSLVVGTNATAFAGAYSYAVVLKFVGGNGTAQAWFVLREPDNDHSMGFNRTSANVMRWSTWAGNSDISPTPTFTTTDGWMLFAYTRTAGAGQMVRAHYKRAADGSVTHVDTGEAQGNTTGVIGGTFIFGADAAGGSFLNGRIAAAAAWDGTALSDGNVDALAGANKAGWLALSPTNMWEFSQATTASPVLDEVANADQTAITGTTVEAADDPPSGIYQPAVPVVWPPPGSDNAAEKLRVVQSNLTVR